MTSIEAKIILGLEENDIPTREGLNGYRKIAEERLLHTMSKGTKSILRRELAAIRKLEDFYGFSD